jgi:hypothetical protein
LRLAELLLLVLLLRLVRLLQSWAAELLPAEARQRVVEVVAR